MNKLVLSLMTVAFATLCAGAFAGSHGGAMSDKDKAAKLDACKKMDAKADDKMKAECKKLEEMKK